MTPADTKRIQTALDNAQVARDRLDLAAGELLEVDGFTRPRAMLASAYQLIGEAIGVIHREALKRNQSKSKDQKR